MTFETHINVFASNFKQFLGFIEIKCKLFYSTIAINMVYVWFIKQISMFGSIVWSQKNLSRKLKMYNINFLESCRIN